VNPITDQELLDELDKIESGIRAAEYALVWESGRLGFRALKDACVRIADHLVQLADRISEMRHLDEED